MPRNFPPQKFAVCYLVFFVRNFALEEVILLSDPARIGGNAMVHIYSYTTFVNLPPLVLAYPYSVQIRLLFVVRNFPLEEVILLAVPSSTGKNAIVNMYFYTYIRTLTTISVPIRSRRSLCIIQRALVCAIELCDRLEKSSPPRGIYHIAAAFC